MFKRISILFTLLFMLNPIYAADLTWDGDGGNTLWENVNNWGGVEFPTDGDNAEFDGLVNTPDTITGPAIQFDVFNVVPNDNTIHISNTGDFTFYSLSFNGASTNDPALQIDSTGIITIENLMVFIGADTDTIIETNADNTLNFNTAGLNISGEGLLRTGTSLASFAGQDINISLGTIVGTAINPLLLDPADEPAGASVGANSELIFSYRAENSPTVTTQFSNSGEITYVQAGVGAADFTAADVFTNFTGRATFNLSTAGSTVSISPDQLTNATVEVNTGLISFSQGGVLTASFPISGTGGITISAGTNLTLEEACDYTGTTTIENGNDLQGSTETFSNSSDIVCDGFLTFEQNTDGSFAPVISGGVGGLITKNGTGSLTLTGASTFEGQLTVNAGTVQSTNTLSQATIEVVTGATFKGNTTVNNLTNEGTVAPGNSIGTITVLGNYTSVPGSNLEIEVSPNQADFLDITGSATLDGTLTLLPETGNYTGGTTYTIVDADGGLGGTTFDTVVNNTQIDFGVSYTTNAVILTVLGPGNLIPIPISQLRGNPKVIADYLYANAFAAPTGSQLAAAVNALNGLSTQDFPIALLKVSQLPYLGLEQVNLQNDVRLSNSFISNFRRFCQRRINKKRRPFLYEDQLGLFVEPIFFFYHQEQDQGKLTDIGQVAFDSYTYGASGGLQCYFGTHFNLQLGLGYTHTDVFWKREFASGYFNTIYVGPVFGWYAPKFYGNLTVMGAFNFYELDRKIEFGSYKQKANTIHSSYDVLVSIDSGYKLPLEGLTNWYFVPEGQFNYLTLYTPAYYESGASDLNLKVYNQYNVWCQPNVKFRLLKEFYGRRFCFSPSLFIGWLGNIPVTKNPSKARFQNIQTERRYFEITGMKETTNQLMLGAEMAVQNCDQFKASLRLQYDVQDMYQIYEANARIDWLF